MRLIARARTDERGFVMIVVVLAMLLVLTVTGVTLQVAGGAGGTTGQGSGDVQAARYDRDSKRSFEAAEAGLQWFAAQFGTDPNYWTKCTTGTAPQNMQLSPAGTQAPVSNRGAGAARVWARVPDSEDATVAGSGEWFNVELVPRTTGTPCSTASPETTLLDSTGRSFRLVVTGSAGDPNSSLCSGSRTCPKRAITATFRRSSFLDYLWFTNLEEYDPLVALTMNKIPAATTTQTSPLGGTDYQSWWTANCMKHHWEGRDDPANVATFNYSFFYYQGTTKKTASGTGRTLGCVPLAFGDDTFSGPVHSEDSLRLCGQTGLGTVFGRNALDPVEIANGNPDVASGGPVGSPTGYPSTYACQPSPFVPKVTYKGRLNMAANSLPMPTSNAALQSKATGVYLITGAKHIQLLGTQVKIGASKGTGTTYSMPPNGVIYVQDGAGCPAGSQRYTPTDPQSTNAACGDAYVSGTYSQSPGLTIAAANDIVVEDDICLVSCATAFSTSAAANPSTMLGLIGNNYVRVWHPVANKPTRYDINGDCSSAESTGLGSVRLDAAVLALQGSFMVDSFECGNAPQGTLSVNGAIVQGLRGGVGQIDTTTGALKSGYAKNYTYDDRFHARNPPQFLDPAVVAWNIVKVSEQLGAS